MKQENQTLIKLVTKNLDLTEEERKSLDWLSGWETSTVKNICNIIAKTKHNVKENEFRGIKVVCEKDKEGIAVIASIEGYSDEITASLKAIFINLLDRPEFGASIIAGALSDVLENNIIKSLKDIVS